VQPSVELLMDSSKALAGYIGASCLVGAAAILEIAYLSPRVSIVGVLLWVACVVVFARGSRLAHSMLCAFTVVCAFAVIVMQSGRSPSLAGIGLLGCIALQLAFLMQARAGTRRHI
jgi:hypothetical protein